jgi:hypothetical protein
LAFDAHSDPSGCGFAPAPIPNNPLIVGKTYYAQTFWVESHGAKCAPSGLVSSKGLSITIGP